jgi:raffinose/stachyose/melibiose transport system substrate-binding protein
MEVIEVKKALVLTLLAALVVFGSYGVATPKTAAQDEVTLVLGSWRVDDANQMETILNAFHESHPNITVVFDPTNPPDYNATLQSQFESGTAPDLMYVRSFATGRGLYDQGFLADLSDLPGMQENFSEGARSAWTTEDGVNYAVPMIAVSHGVYYNVDLFNELGIAIPTTWEELLAAAQTLKDNGYDAFANASGDTWTIAEIVFMNIAPNFIGGREGRLAYLNGERCFNDENAVAAFQAVADLGPYVPEDNTALTYYDSQQIFLMGEAGMWLGGSWDIPVFEAEEPDFEWSVFAVPAREGQEQQYITFHTDAGLGMNAATEHPEEARVFLEWAAGPEFATLLANELPGFFPLQNEAPVIENEHAAAFIALNEGREQDVRWAWEGLLAGTPDGYTLMQDNAIAVLNGEETAQEAADALQEGLAQWFEPAQNCPAAQ